MYVQIAEKIWPASSTYSAPVPDPQAGGDEDNETNTNPQASGSGGGDANRDSDEDEDEDEDLEARILKSRAKLISEREDDIKGQNRSADEGIGNLSALPKAKKRVGKGVSPARRECYSDTSSVVHYTDTPCSM